MYMEMLSQLPTWNKHRTTCCNTIAYSPPLQPPTSHPVVCPFVQPGSTTAAAVPFQVARAKLSINSRKVVNIQTRDSPPIYHKQLHGTRTSISSSFCIRQKAPPTLARQQARMYSPYPNNSAAGGHSLGSQPRKPLHNRTEKPQLETHSGGAPARSMAPVVVSIERCDTIHMHYQE